MEVLPKSHGPELGAIISFLLWFNFGYLLDRRNTCVDGRTVHVTSQYAVRRCTHGLTLRTIGQLTEQEEKLCSLVKFVKVLTRA